MSFSLSAFECLLLPRWVQRKACCCSGLSWSLLVRNSIPASTPFLMKSSERRSSYEVLLGYATRYIINRFPCFLFSSKFQTFEARSTFEFVSLLKKFATLWRVLMGGTRFFGCRHIGLFERSFVNCFSVSVCVLSLCWQSKSKKEGSHRPGFANLKVAVMADHKEAH